MTTLDELKKLLKAGTPGPWWTPPAEQNDTQGLVFMGRDGGFDLRFSPLPKANAALIVAAINALPGLIESARRVERLRSALAELADEFDNMVFLPEAGCSCHVLPPCSDCVEYSAARAARESARAALKETP